MGEFLFCGKRCIANMVFLGFGEGICIHAL